MQSSTVHPDGRLLLHAKRLVLNLPDLNLHALLLVDRRQKVLNNVVLPVLHRTVPLDLLRLQVDILDVHPSVVTKIPKGNLYKFLSE